jgi:prefoldin subunit 5
MNNEQVIMEQLDHLGQEIATLTDSARSLRELRDDLSPRVNETVKVLIEQLAEMEADVQFEDLTALLKNLMRNVRNLGWSVDQLKNLIDFLRTVEPLLKSAVPQAIIYLDKLERQGVFRVVASMMGVLEKIAETYTPEDIEQIENGLVPLVGVAKKLTTPEALNLLDKAAEVPARVDLSQAKAVGPFSMLFALGNSEVKQGMGVVLELTKALSVLKNGDGAGESKV